MPITTDPAETPRSVGSRFAWFVAIYAASAAATIAVAYGLRIVVFSVL